MLHDGTAWFLPFGNRQIRVKTLAAWFAIIGIERIDRWNSATRARSMESVRSFPKAGTMCISTITRQFAFVFGLQRGSTCFPDHSIASSAIVGQSPGIASMDSATGSSPALIREMINAARRRASSAANTPWRLTVTHFSGFTVSTGLDHVEPAASRVYPNPESESSESQTPCPFRLPMRLQCAWKSLFFPVFLPNEIRRPRNASDARIRAAAFSTPLTGFTSMHASRRPDREET